MIKLKCPECCYEKEVEEIVRMSICHHCLTEMQRVEKEREEKRNGKRKN
jgi:hypothetical protein